MTRATPAAAAPLGRTAATAAVLLALAWAFLLGYGAAAIRYAPPDCPTEDSCRADYANGEWRIISTD